ncbi:hypothetical protein QBC44DRAFT_364554 [Cladorrhinum sp. PSN332]|nr:hypothetical protein QBC44DRAFT_364554 [Cladorrhinum sp. PSN332]
MTACCTCATLLANSSSSAPRIISSTSEKPVSDRKLDCCSRIICADCIDKNPRFLSYCPYCQPSGRASSSSSRVTTSPPPYTPSSDPFNPPGEEKSSEPIIHFLLPTDSIPSLSLAYNIPPHLLRKFNNLTSDHLLFARQTLLVPAGYSAKSHSPRPVESEAELLRKNKIRRWMVSCKESDYDMAVTYLEGSGYDLEESVKRYKDDVEWEKSNPLQKKVNEKKKTKEKGNGGGGGGGWFWGLGL